MKAGGALGTFDAAKNLPQLVLEDTTMVIVTNTADYASVTPVATGSVAKGDAIIEVKSLIETIVFATGHHPILNFISQKCVFSLEKRKD